VDIDNLSIDPGPSIHYSLEFRSVLEDHMTYLRSHQDTTLLTLEPNEAAKWRSDLFGILTTKQVPAKYHWVIMRANSMLSPTDFNEETTTLIIPSYSEVDKIQRIHQTRSKTSL